MSALITTVRYLSLALSAVVLADLVVSFFLSPYHPFRQALDSLVNPMLAPIRRILPPIGMIDFSPVVLLILIRVLQDILVRIIVSLG